MGEFILPAVNLSLVAGVVVFVLRVVAKGTWMPKATHDEIVADWRARYEETKSDRDYWRTSTMDLSGITERLVGPLEKAVQLGK